MAYNLTYDPTDDPQAIEESEARDQENLEIGERLHQEQENLLAGKYRDAQELEQAYIELQKKLGSRDPEQSAEQEPEQLEEEEESDDVDYSFLNRIAEEAESGEFTEETIAALNNLSAAEIADMFLAYRQENGEQETGYQMSDEDVTEMKGVVGGEQQYNAMISWASQNMTEQEVEAYDAVMDGGDPRAIWFAIQALNYRYQDSVGTEGRLLTGNAPRSGDVFRSQAEVVRAMNDPRYESDPAYRQDIYNKLERSNI